MQAALDIHADLAQLGDVCTRMGSPFFGALLRRAADAYETDVILRDLLDRHAHRSRLGLRLGGAAQYRALRAQAPAIAAHYPSTGGDGDTEAAWNAIVQDIRAHAGEYDDLFARPVQTNEVARAMPVLGAMLALAETARMPLRIFEIGSSAGLILNFDRYRYEGEDWSWGDAASPLHLRNQTASGSPKHLRAKLEIAQRHGCDLHPLDAADEAGAATLLSFIWPDQRERFERLRAAIAIAREHPVPLARADGIEWIRANAQPCDGFATVVLHTVMTEHMTDEQRASLRDAADALGARASAAAPFAWIRMEPSGKGYDTTLTQWPGAQERTIAQSDGHAQNLRWHE